jgi:hypothetical protein
MTSGINPPLVSGYIQREFKYTPIYIEFVSPVLIVESGEDSEPLSQYFTPAKLKITNPSSRLPGGRQAFSRPQFVSIPDEGPLYLKLLPSDLYTPQGRYKVEVFFSNSSIAVDVQYWVVPYSKKEKTVEIIASGDVEDTIPHGADEAVFTVNDISRSGDYTLIRDVITWDVAPTKGERYSVSYQPAATLSDLVDVTHIEERNYHH